MAAIEQTFEFDESELYNEAPTAQEDMSEEEAAQADAAAQSCSDSDSDFQPDFDKLSADGDGARPLRAPLPRARAPAAAAADAAWRPPPAGGSESSKSASLQVSLQDLHSQEHSPPEHLSKAALGTTYTKSFYNPRPAPSARLGTSAPIAIPHMSRWKLGSPAEEAGAGAAAPAPNVSATFIPPHQLSQKDDFMFSFTGASPSAVIKRDRLRQRNAILRSTGFLEKGAKAASPLPQEPVRPQQQSSLTAALSTIGEL
jgi:hypothetical protein